MCSVRSSRAAEHQGWQAPVGPSAEEAGRFRVYISNNVTAPSPLFIVASRKSAWPAANRSWRRDGRDLGLHARMPECTGHGDDARRPADDQAADRCRLVLPARERTGQASARIRRLSKKHGRSDFVGAFAAPTCRHARDRDLLRRSARSILTSRRVISSVSAGSTLNNGMALRERLLAAVPICRLISADNWLGRSPSLRVIASSSIGYETRPAGQWFLQCRTAASGSASYGKILLKCETIGLGASARIMRSPFPRWDFRAKYSTWRRKPFRHRNDTPGSRPARDVPSAICRRMRGGAHCSTPQSSCLPKGAWVSLCRPWPTGWM